jgi:glyoxylase-like metal-dependent hydrolase (beta-lactamase superfamily II)
VSDADDISRRACGAAQLSLVAWVWESPFRPLFAVSDAEIKAAVPEADESSRIPIDFTSLHIAAGDLSVIVDPGVATDEQRGRESRARFGRGFVAALGELGIDRDRVTHVVISHRHGDHLNGVLLEDGLAYPNARHLISRIDREQGGAELDALLGPVERAGLLDLVDGDHEIAPGVDLLATPGETPGHISLRLRSEGETFFWVGDLLHHNIEIRNADWGPTAQASELAASRRRIWTEAATTDALVLWAHEAFPGWGHVESVDGGHAWRPLAS